MIKITPYRREVLLRLAGGPRTSDDARDGHPNILPMLIGAGLVHSVGGGLYEVTEEGRALIARGFEPLSGTINRERKQRQKRERTVNKRPFLNCIRCDQQLANIMPKGVQPVGGLAFHTHGHYGSAFFDPLDGTHIQIVVCDACLGAAQDRVIGPSGYAADYDWSTFGDDQPSMKRHVRAPSPSVHGE